MRTTSNLLALSLTVLLAACSAGDKLPSSTDGATDESEHEEESENEAESEPAERYAFSVEKDGIDVCFREVRKALGADGRVSEIISYFSAGADVDPGDDEPKGTLTTCRVDYQSPEDKRKLLRMSMDMHTGAFEPPSKVELSVTGDAASFNLDDYVVEMSKVDTAPLQAFMDSQKPALDKVYSAYAWDDIRLDAPGAFSNTHRLAVRLTGRFKSNDLENTGDAMLSINGKTVLDNDLTK